MTDFEKLGVFFLGKEYDLETRQPRESLVLYDSKDLCTHAVCVGMTGSGKTGLCLSLLEEAAIDGIPAICIDPKGDVGNLLLTFPDLKQEDFRPWIDAWDAAREGVSPDELAASTANAWREGLTASGQGAERIRRFKEEVDLAIYTPGSTAGLPLTVLKSFAAPPAALVADADAMRERLTASAAGLLALLGHKGDPLRSREHILIMLILEQAWRAGKNVGLAELVHAVQQPAFDKVGVIDLESFFPSKKRHELAVQLNNLLASPGFSTWTEGEPLDVQRLLFTSSGKPRLSIVSIAHLSEAERMFFVTLLLNEVIAWMRTQSGTSSLRAILYMDEVFGYFPPTANPPSKMPMLTLLKQARAYGLGVVLATQNPVDLDYKGLSNAGTWFLGRLQTERDKARVLDGLEGASAAAGATFDRGTVERTLSGLATRVFLMNNVHEDAPVVFQTRWALSYLRGPLTRDQIATLMASHKERLSSSPGQEASKPAVGHAQVKAGERPLFPPGVTELFLPRRGNLPPEASLVYRPQLSGEAKVHFVDAKNAIDRIDSCTVLVTLDGELPQPAWDEGRIEVDAQLEFDAKPEEGARFASVPAELLQTKALQQLATQLKDYLYRNHRLTLYKAPRVKKTSQPDEEEGDFRARLAHELKEQRDQALEKLKGKYAAKWNGLQEQVRKAQQRVDKEKEQASSQTMTSVITFGTSILGALLGRKLVSATNMTKAGASMRSATRAMKERQDIGHAADTVEAYQQRLADLEAEFKAESDKLAEQFDAHQLHVEQVEIRPKKADVQVSRVAIVWTPWHVLTDGREEPAS